jgi:hypothetical protein
MEERPGDSLMRGTRHSDGTPHVTGVPVRPRPDPAMPVGRIRAVVLATYEVGHDGNRWGMGVECDLVTYDDRRPLYNVPVEQRGGVRDVELWRPSPTTRSLTSGEELVFDRSENAWRWLAATQLKDLDGDHVTVAFFGGRADAPVIVGSLPHPRAERRLRVVATTIGSTHPALPEGACRYTEVNGAKLLQDHRGNLVLDTRGAGTTNGGQELEGDEPAGTIFVQARAGQAIRIVIGEASIVLAGGEVRINGGEQGAARKGDAVEVDLEDPANATWKTYLTGAANGAPPPPDKLKGTITTASETVFAGG